MTRGVLEKGSYGDPGTWCMGVLDERRVVFLTCPDCHSTGPLLEHSIGDDGAVTPSVVCDCGFHEHVRLKRWRGGGRGGK